MNLSLLNILFLLQESEPDAVSDGQEEIVSLIIYVSLLIIIIIVFLITFFLAYHKRKTQLLIEKAEQQRFYEEEISKTQTEIQEQTMKNVSWELHDNIGQLLSVARMQLNMLQRNIPEDNMHVFKDASETLGQSLQEVRQLSHMLNTDFVSKMGLQESVERELARFKRLQLLNIDYQVKGDPRKLEDKDELVIFRILQEFFSNTVKYADADTLRLVLNYTDEALDILVADDGHGFDMDEEGKGLGLMNMKKRAALIGADLSMKASKNKGVSLSLKYLFKPADNEKVYSDSR
ncbi:sensor histidine kinase [Robertkochia aurantiaca]|uniref:sensor histidine kinase n=1 Tax=Robertkochia aurantiaca TaxID=2873700 RepID=UPI001CCCA74B|nr:histidine kinase [Robertkochia sp. 3YJGBD-33]